MKTISFEEAKPGDWLVSDGGSVRVEVVQHDHKTGYIFAKDAGNAHGAKEWQRLGFHVEREDPPKVVRVKLAVDATSGRISLPTGFYGSLPPGEYVDVIFPADLLNELEKAAREWFRTPSSQCRSEHRLFTALNACGIGTARAEGDER